MVSNYHASIPRFGLSIPWNAGSRQTGLPRPTARGPIPMPSFAGIDEYRALSYDVTSTVLRSRARVVSTRCVPTDAGRGSSGNPIVGIGEAAVGNDNAIVNAVLKHHPQVQAVYLFGTYGTEHERPGSDVDIAVLLSTEDARQSGSLTWSGLHVVLEQLLGKDIDLINLRRASTVLQKEVIFAGRRIFCTDRYAAEEFEMLVLSFYQKLNEERAEILAVGLRSGRFIGA